MWDGGARAAQSNDCRASTGRIAADRDLPG